jgi:F-type H+-transporting ATPase subunit gamma
LLREAAKAHSPTTVYVVAGRKAAQWVARLKRELVAEFSYKDAPEFAEARAISKFAQELFLSGQADAVDVVFTNYVNTLTQKAELRSLLPLGRLQKLEADLRGNGSAEEIQSSTSREFGFEPAAPQLLGNLLPHYLNYQVYQMLLEAKASEHSARMVAMKSATDNAKQLIKDLTLEYNKLRQANITKELLEITSAAMAMGN